MPFCCRFWLVVECFMTVMSAPERKLRRISRWSLVGGVTRFCTGLNRGQRFQPGGASAQALESRFSTLLLIGCCSDRSTRSGKASGPGRAVSSSSKLLA